MNSYSLIQQIAFNLLISFPYDFRKAKRKCKEVITNSCFKRNQSLILEIQFHSHSQLTIDLQITFVKAKRSVTAQALKHFLCSK